MSKQEAELEKYPWTKKIDDKKITFRLMEPSDKEAMLEFARSLPEDDLVFLAVDITKEEAVDDWVRRLNSNFLRTILVEEDGKLLGHGSLIREEQVWTRHLGGIILLLSPGARGKGIGQLLANELFAYANKIGLQKVMVRMAVEQRGALQVFEKLGFKEEALLTDCVIDRNGTTHDLVIMSYDITGFNE